MVVQIIYAVIDDEVEEYNIGYFISKEKAYNFIKHIVLQSFEEELDTAKYTEDTIGQEAMEENIACLNAKKSMEEIKQFVDDYYGVGLGFSVKEIYVED